MLAPVANAAAQDEPGPATVGRRFAAYGLDLAFFLPIVFLTQLVFGFVGFVVPQARLGEGVLLFTVSAAVGFVIAHGYLAATMLRAGLTYGQTFGRRALRIRVVRADGARLTQLTILARETLPKYVLPLSAPLVMAWSVPVGSALLAVWLVDSLAAVTNRGGRSLHDLLAGTRSIGAAVVPHAAAIADRGSPEYSPTAFPSAGAPTDPDLAEYGPRLAAALLDGLFSYLIFGACAALAIGLEQLGVPGPGLPLFVGLFVLIFYSTLLTIRRGRTNGQTFGKQLMGIRVVREDGERITLGVAFFRELVLTEIPRVLTIGLYLIVDSLWPLWEGQRRALHDLGAGTRVVRGAGDGEAAQLTSRSSPVSTS
jgi:uncharacterized RDD family membrane protein YckC